MRSTRTRNHLSEITLNLGQGSSSSPLVCSAAISFCFCFGSATIRLPIVLAFLPVYFRFISAITTPSFLCRLL